MSPRSDPKLLEGRGGASFSLGSKHLAGSGASISAESVWRRIAWGQHSAQKRSLRNLSESWFAEQLILKECVFIWGDKGAWRDGGKKLSTCSIDE